MYVLMFLYMQLPSTKLITCPMPAAKEPHNSKKKGSVILPLYLTNFVAYLQFLLDVYYFLF